MAHRWSREPLTMDERRLEIAALQAQSLERMASALEQIIELIHQEMAKEDDRLHELDARRGDNSAS